MFCPATVVQAMNAKIASKRNFFIIMLFDVRYKDTKKNLKNTPFSKIPSKIIHSAPRADRVRDRNSHSQRYTSYTSSAPSPDVLAAAYGSIYT
jgi:hypothetical protein